MATKKYLSLERLTEYDELIKGVISSGDDATLASAKSYTDTVASGKSDTGHNHDDRYYTETEIDTKLSEVNTSITNITSGTVVVKEAEHATNADTATNATNANHATSADTATNATSATQATQDGSGNVITSTYETKTDASAKLDEAKAYADDLASGKSDTGHNHDDKYYTETEIDTKIDTLNTAIDGKASSSHTHTIAEVVDLQTSLDGKVSIDRTVNGKALSSDVVLSASDVDAYSKSEIDNMEFITVDDVDVICGGSIPTARGVKF